MAKKRKSSSKKHRFSPENLGTVPAQAASVAKKTSEGEVSASNAGSAPAVGFATAQIVRRDVGRVLLLAAGFIGLMIVLWVLFTHTSLGSDVYSAVKL